MTRNRALAALLLAGVAALTAGCSDEADASTTAGTAAPTAQGLCLDAVKSTFNSDADVRTVIDFARQDTDPAGYYFGSGTYNGTGGLRSNWAVDCTVTDEGTESAWASLGNITQF